MDVQQFTTPIHAMKQTWILPDKPLGLLWETQSNRAAHEWAVTIRLILDWMAKPPEG